MTKMTITCDNCNKDLQTKSLYPAVYALHLTVQNVNTNTSNIQYLVHVEPPFVGSKNFCNIKCLQEWSSNEIR